MKTNIYIKFMCFLLIFIIANYSYSNVVIFADNSSINISTMSIKEDTPEFKCNLNLPTIETNTGSNISEHINNEIFCFANNLKDKFKNDSKEYLETIDTQESSIRPYVLSSEYHIPYNQEGLISIKNVFYEYTAGAHGYYYLRTYTLDFNNNKKLFIKDLFINEYDYNKVILGEIINQVSLHPELYFPEYIQDVDKLPTSYNFFIEPGFIVVYYDLYEIAPFASGIPEFKIPVSLFGENLKFKL